VHPPMIAERQPPGKVPGGPLPWPGVLVAYQRPRVKKPSSARTRITIRMIQRRLTLIPPFPWSSVQRSPLQRRRRVRGCVSDFRLEPSGNRPRRGWSPRRCVDRPRQSRRREPARRQPDPGRLRPLVDARPHRERGGRDLLRPRRHRLVLAAARRRGRGVHVRGRRGRLHRPPGRP
jgi:hypothetical protein